jgi:hypothetical protein
MNRLGTLASAFVATAVVAGCSPTLTGAACQTDCNCPSAQRCARNPDGGNGSCVTGANYCGKDAGPALFGVLTLNGGIPKPANNAASVYAWDHAPLIFGDGGLETPLLSTPTNSDGTWELPDGTAGTTYYLVGTYAINSGKTSWSLPAPQIANNRPLDVDVPTYGCLVWSELPMASAMPMPNLAGLVADVPNITDGTELSNATVKVSDGTNHLTLSLTTQAIPPFIPIGLYGWNPSASSAPKAVVGAYTFTITGEGYDAGTKCSVNTTSLESVPAALTVPATWFTNEAQTVTFSPPREAQFSFIGITDGAGNAVQLPSSDSAILHGTNSATVSVPFAPGILGSAACPAGGPQCTLTVLSVHETFTGNTGVDEASSSTTQAFYTAIGDGG